ncbi:MAG: hypothetical protein LBN12_04370 [Clostridiales Family XIII bacterium]|jgi:hypothetical protein|nr:hypothetical protein [Clostridiales Family XIII bacterium]
MDSPINVGCAHSSGRCAPCAVRFASQIKDLGQKGKSANDRGANFSLSGKERIESNTNL